MMKTYTIVFGDESVRHVSEAQYAPIAAAIGSGADSFTIGNEYFSRRDVKRVNFFDTWRDAEEQKLLRREKQMYVCEFGQFHGSHERCRCAGEGRFPCTEKAQRLIEAYKRPRILPHINP